MSSQKRPRTVSLSLSARGQTTQDFVVGIGIFLLAVAFVFSFVPSIITPYTAATTAETAQADRIADAIVSEYDEGHNELDLRNFDEFDANEYGIRAVDDVAVDRVNVTVTDGEGEVRHAAGNEYEGESAGSASRVITTTDDECDPSCRLIVRVW